MSQSNRRQYYDVVRAAHEDNQHREVVGVGTPNGIETAITATGYFQAADPLLGDMVSQFVAGRQHPWSADGLRVLDAAMGIVSVPCQVFHAFLAVQV